MLAQERYPTILQLLEIRDESEALEDFRWGLQNQKIALRFIHLGAV